MPKWKRSRLKSRKKVESQPKIDLDQALARFAAECPEFAAAVPEDERPYLRLGYLKRVLSSFMDAGQDARLRQTMALLEGLQKDADSELANTIAVVLLEHLPELGARKLDLVLRVMGPATRQNHDAVMAYNEAIQASRQLPRKKR